MTPGHRQWKKSILTGGALCAAWWPYPPFIWNNSTFLGLNMFILIWTTPHGLNVTSAIPPFIYSVGPGNQFMLLDPDVFFAGAGEAQGQAPSAGRPKSASPKSKGRKKVVLGDNVSGVQIDLSETAGQNLVPDVVLELEESEMANKRGHVLIAIENPNRDLDIKILVRVGGLGFAAVYFTLLLTCVVF